jgi:hypothetical protein
MNMSEDVSGAVVGMSTTVAQKGVDLGVRLVDKTVENIAKLLKALFGKSPNQEPEVKSSDMTELHSGEAELKALIGDAKKNGDTVVSTDGYSKDDVKFINAKAKEYGIPVAYTNKADADNICAHIRGSDKAIFERISTELINDKLAARPQELDNFKAERWEIDGIQHELSKHDLNANWGKTKDGEYFCLFEKTDRKAVLIARGEFLNKCNDVEKNLSVTKAEDGFYTLKDENSGKVLAFDEIPSKSELSATLQQKFGYDENKADIACNKFGEKHLEGDVKREFFKDAPRHSFSKIENHVELKGESILAKEYDCLRVTPKEDGVPRLVYRDKDNNFAILNPERMTRRAMAAQLRESLGIKDEQTVAALVDKADKVTDYYIKQNSENFTHIPAGNVESSIERLGKDEFKIVSADTTGTRELTLSFSDKKNALAELQNMYESQGVPADVAKQSAKEVFAKAQAQSAEKVLHIEEIKAEKISMDAHGGATPVAAGAVLTVKYGHQTEEINIGDRDEAAREIGEKFGVAEAEATMLLDKAQEKIDGDREKVITNDKNVQEKTPAKPIKPEKPDVKLPDAAKPELPKGGEPPAVEMPKRSGRK